MYSLRYLKYFLDKRRYLLSLDPSECPRSMLLQRLRDMIPINRREFLPGEPVGPIVGWVACSRRACRTRRPSSGCGLVFAWPRAAPRFWSITGRAGAGWPITAGATRYMPSGSGCFFTPRKLPAGSTRRHEFKLPESAWGVGRGERSEVIRRRPGRTL